MYTRPKFGESDEDLLKLQEEFNRHKATNDFKLASTLVSSKIKDNAVASVKCSEREKTDEIQEHLANTFEDIPKSIHIGSIFENKGTSISSQVKLSRLGFPQAKRRDLHVTANKGSIFSQQMKKMKSDNAPVPCSSKTLDSAMDIDLVVKVKDKPGTASAFESQTIKDEIHLENLDKMNKMSQEEVLEERDKLMSTLDPAIIAFLKSRRHHNQLKADTGLPTIAQQNEYLNIESIECTRDILSRPDAEKWIHFDVLESNKLAWMQSLKKPDFPKDETYEARFDFAGWLLPYSYEQKEITDCNRSLYHHGEEPGRPGYTLQELFQLCRSSVIQQKVIALHTIAAILQLHSSGLYDKVIEIPLEQVFFVLRFCLDENSPATLNASIKALRNLFTSQIDETCLDCLLGFGGLELIPILAVDEEADDNTVNDQQLAESNLVKCLLRSGILTRIRYIFTVVKPTEIETIIYCLDILVRLARDSDFVVEQVWTFPGLIPVIMESFVPKVFTTVKSASAYGSPIVQAVKLLRVLSGRSQNIAKELVFSYKVLEPIATYLSNESLSLNTTGLKLQIESLQLCQTVAYFSLGMNYFQELRPVLLKLFDYHLKNTNVDASWIKQTHLAALLSLQGEINVTMLFELGIPKWLSQFTGITTFSCGKLQVISSLFHFLTTIYTDPLPWEDCYDLVETLISSRAFSLVTAHMQSSSNILNNYDVHKSSPNLLTSEAVVWDTGEHIVPVLQTNSCLPFVKTLAAFIRMTKSSKLKCMFLNHENIKAYMNAIQTSCNFYMTTNWYSKIESQMIVNLLRVAVDIQQDVDTSLYYEVAVKSLCLFAAEHKADVDFLFKSIIFSPQFYPSEVLLKNLHVKDEPSAAALSDISNIQKVYADVLRLQTNLTTNRALNISSENIIPLDWVYSPIIALYSQTSTAKVPESRQTFIISNCLRWVYIYETWFPELARMINATDKFCRLACTFLGSDTLFLLPDIQQRLTICLRQILTQHASELNFDKPIHGLTSFNDLYIQLLEQYQGVSYGDKLFGQFLLVPLAQRQNVKFRKAVWSEYAGIVQIFNVTEEDLIGDVATYLEPRETDLSLLKCYQRILSMGAVRESSIFHKIAKHHVEAFIRSESERNKTHSII